MCYYRRFMSESSSSLPEKTIGPGGALSFQIAQRLVSRKEAIVDCWMADLRERRDIPSADPLTSSELMDHVPGLLDELAKSFERGGMQPSAERTAEQARAHGRHRWDQGFKLDELIRDISDLKARVIDVIQEFLATMADGALEGRDRFRAFELVREFFDNLSVGSVREYMQQREGELATANEALAIANAQANELSQTRLKMVRTVSHELRNSANALSIVTTLLEEMGEELKIRAECVAILRRNLGDMTALLNGLLDYSTTLEKPAQPKIAEVDLTVLERELTVDYKRLSEERGIRFTASTDPALRIVQSDRLKLRQIASNLLSNAFKFTKVGSVNLAFSSQDDDRWVLRVTDTGSGISSEHQTRLFREFERLAPGNVPGTGLGLVIARQIARELGGDIIVTSEVGKGSTFDARFPRSPS